VIPSYNMSLKAFRRARAIWKKTLRIRYLHARVKTSSSAATITPEGVTIEGLQLTLC
jgi:hypothetical protein